MSNNETINTFLNDNIIIDSQLLKNLVKLIDKSEDSIKTLEDELPIAEMQRFQDIINKIKEQKIQEEIEKNEQRKHEIKKNSLIIPYKENTYSLYNFVCSPYKIYLEQINKSRKSSVLSLLLHCNFELLNIYITQNNQKKYELKIHNKHYFENKLYCLTKNEFVNFLKAHNLSCYTESVKKIC